MSIEEATSVVESTSAAKPVSVIKETANLAAKILKQVEFYFGDANLPRDKFLQEAIKENEGWVQLSVLATFSRMKILSEDIAVIADAVEQSAELLELSEDRTCIRRKTDLPEALDNLSTSVYVKGFPLDATLDSIEELLAGAFDGKISAIRMRRAPNTKEFKGSVFVELTSAEEAGRLAAMTLSLPEASEPLVMLVKAKYFENKNAERTNTKSKYEKTPEEERPFEYTKGCLLVVEGVPETVTFDQLKEALNAVQPVAFAEIDNGTATIRFKEALPETLQEGIAEFAVGEQKLTGRKATEEEEKTYFDNFLQTLKAKSARARKASSGGRSSKRQRK